MSAESSSPEDGSRPERVVFLDGRFVTIAEARVSVMDRGFLFADGVYEVSAVIEGGLVDNDAHLARLDRSLAMIGIVNPYSAEGWTRLQRELVRCNGLVEGTVYIQVTRGVAERDFAFAENLVPTVVMFTQAKPVLDTPAMRDGIAAVTRPDLRWARRDIKTIGLLPQVLAKREARDAGAAEVFMVEDGAITEGGSSTIFAVLPDRRLVTRPLSNAVLPGITRRAVMRLAADAELTLEERPIRVEELAEATEVFITSASHIVVPVVSVDARPIGDGRPGPQVRRLQALYRAMARAEAAADRGA